METLPHKKGKKAIKITDTVLRDAHQSLLATRMRTEDMVDACAMLDKVGFHSLEMWGGATFDSCIRFLNEDPWDRLRTLRKALPNTQLQMLLRGQNILGYRNYADDVVERFVERSAENGIDIFRIFDALNDLRNLKTAIKAAKKMKKHAQGTISYTISPVHSNEKFVELGFQLVDMGVDSIAIKDMAGLLLPEPGRELIHILKEKTNLPIQLHTHSTSGLAMMTYLKAIEAGVDIIDCAISSLALGTSQPPTEAVVAALRGTDYDTGYDLELLSKISKYFAQVRKKYAEFESQFVGIDTNVLIYQIPGGMMSNLESQLREQGHADKMDLVLEEIPKVRKDLGYPPLVTPTSQIVGTQAVFNVVAGERYKMITKETREYVKGNYGQPQGVVDPALIKKVCGDEPPNTRRPADLIAPEFEKMKKELTEELKGTIPSDEDVLICALFPEPGKNFLRNRGKAVPASNQSLQEPAKPVQSTVSLSKTSQETPNLEGFDQYEIVVNDKSFQVHVRPVGELRQGIQVTQIRSIATPTRPAPEPAPSSSTATVATPKPASPSSSAGGQEVRSEMSGAVISIGVSVGDMVTKGQNLIKIEAMKMEIDIPSPFEGKITEILCQVGEKIQTGGVLIRIA